MGYCLTGVSEDANLVEDMREPRSDGLDNPGRILRSILLDTNKGIYDYLPYDIFSPRFKPGRQLMIILMTDIVMSLSIGTI